MHICGMLILMKLTNEISPDSKVHGANLEPTWVLSAPDSSHVGPENIAIREGTKFTTETTAI